MATLTLVDNGDRWKALYLDGEIVTQGHYADDPETVVNVCMNNEIDGFEKRGISDNGEYPRAEFPDSLEEIREADDWKLR